MVFRFLPDNRQTSATLIKINFCLIDVLAEVTSIAAGFNVIRCNDNIKIKELMKLRRKASDIFNFSKYEFHNLLINRHFICYFA